MSCGASWHTSSVELQVILSLDPREAAEDEGLLVGCSLCLVDGVVVGGVVVGGVVVVMVEDLEEEDLEEEEWRQTCRW